MRKLFAMWYPNITNSFKSHNYIMLAVSLCYILCVAASSCTGKKSERVVAPWGEVVADTVTDD